MNPTYDFTGQVAALVEPTVDTFGRLDFAFNNAGVQAREPLHEPGDAPGVATSLG